MHAVHPLRAHIEAAAATLAAGPVRAADRLLFPGVAHDAYPTLLVPDPYLTDSAKIQFLYLLQEARRQAPGAIAMPGVVQIGRALGHARGTVIRDRLLLRISRWITLCQAVRDRGGRFRGQVFAVFSEPHPLTDVLGLDDGYVALLEDGTRHADPYVRRAAGAALAKIDHDLAIGGEPLARPDPVLARAEAQATLVRGHGCFFGLRSERPRPAGEAEGPDDPPGPDFESARSSPDFEPDPPGPDFEPGPQVIEIHDCSKFGPGPSGTCSRSSKDLEDLTTTTNNDSSKFAGPNFEHPALHWPAALPGNLRHLVERVLREEAPPAGWQTVLDVLARRLTAPGRPVRDLLAYTAALCRRQQEGRLRAVAAPRPVPAIPPAAAGPTAPAAAASTARAAALALRAELRGLGRLVEAAFASPARPALERQIQGLRARVAATAALSACAFGTGPPPRPALAAG